jgi:hypothetical protein
MSLFSPLLTAAIQAGFINRCPIRGLGAELSVIYQDFVWRDKVATQFRLNRLKGIFSTTK